MYKFNINFIDLKKVAIIYKYNKIYKPLYYKIYIVNWFLTEGFPSYLSNSCIISQPIVAIIKQV